MSGEAGRKFWIELFVSPKALIPSGSLNRTPLKYASVVPKTISQIAVYLF
jgi:hypothetical protein